LIRGRERPLSNIDFELKVQKWLADDRSLAARVLRALKSLYYNKAPQRFRFYGALHWLAKTGLAASPPGLGYYYGSLKSLTVVVIATSGIAAGHSLVSFLDALSKEKAKSEGENHSDMLVRLGDLLNAHKPRKSGPPAQKDDAIRACLGILEIFCRQITRSAKGDVAVSLVLYQGSSRQKMSLRHRNPGNLRPVNREIRTEGLLGHFVCAYGAEPQVVDDVREFTATSPTQTKPDYRSIFFYPLEVLSKEGKSIKGFVSIDCKKPYAFYGNRSNDIVVTCEPVLNHIRESIQEPGNARST
jgi:hypothetical protein